MEAPSLDRIQEIYCAALDLPVDARAAYVRDQCAGDDALRREVESLLAVETAAGAFLDEPAFAGLDTLPSVLAPAAYLENSDLAGQSIGPYKLIEVIGRGGMGTVWLAERSDEQFQRRVALKLLRTSHSSSRLIQRFQRERQLLATLEHPNIARLYSGGVTPTGLPYLVMEFVDGVPIRDYCEQRELDLRQRVELMAQVCDAVHYAHQNLIVHRDIKPSNILVNADGDPKLLDFGIAKVVDDTGEAVGEETVTTERMMTPRYASPEQVIGEKITVTSDIYSLGVVLFELLTGESPYVVEGTGRKALEDQVLAGAVRLPSQALAETETASHRRWRRSLLGDLDTITAKALRLEPHRRYASAKQFGEDLRRYLRGRTVQARPDTLGYRSGKFLRRNWPFVTAAVGVTISLLVALVVSYRSIANLEAERQHTAHALEILENALTSVTPEIAGEADTALMRQVLDQARDQLRRGVGADTAVEARLRIVVGRTYLNIGEYSEAVAELERGRRLFHELLGPNDPRSIDADVHYGAALLKDTRLDDAESVLEELVTRTIAELGPEASQTLTARNNLAQCYFDRHDLDRAEAIWREVLDIRRRTMPEAPETAVSCGNLANLLMTRRRFAEAAGFLDDALAILPPSHRNRMLIENNYGYLESMRGNLTEAEARYRRAYDARTELLGPHHPSTLKTLNNIVTLHYRADRLDEAEKLCRELLELRREHLGEDHDDTVLSWMNLSVILGSRDENEEALAIQERVLEIREGKLGPNHPNTLKTLGGLASSLYSSGRVDDAERRARELVDRSNVSLGERDPATLDAHYRLAFLLRKTDRARESANLLEAVVALAPEVLTAKDSDLGYYQVELARSLTVAGDYAKAEPHLESGIRQLRTTLGDTHRYSQNALRAAVELYDAWQRPDRAAEYRRMLVD